MRFTEFKLINEAVDKDVMALQRELKAKGANLGNFGPKGDGIDGRLGKYTRRAADANPEIAAKYKDVLARPDSVDAQKVDTTTIQDPDFKKKVEKFASALGVRSADLMAIFKQESGVNPAAVNGTSGATGLIQFMPKTAIALGTTTDALKQMDGVQQLDYVYKYFKMTGVGNGDLGDLYMAVFMPKYVGYPNETVLGQNGAPGFSGKVYAQNKGLDRNRDGAITVADVKQSVARFA
jgi:hypothetical protein